MEEASNKPSEHLVNEKKRGPILTRREFLRTAVLGGAALALTASGQTSPEAASGGKVVPPSTAESISISPEHVENVLRLHAGIATITTESSAGHLPIKGKGVFIGGYLVTTETVVGDPASKITVEVRGKSFDLGGDVPRATADSRSQSNVPVDTPDLVFLPISEELQTYFSQQVEGEKIKMSFYAEDVPRDGEDVGLFGPDSTDEVSFYKFRVHGGPFDAGAGGGTGDYTFSTELAAGAKNTDFQQGSPVYALDENGNLSNRMYGLVIGSTENNDHPSLLVRSKGYDPRPKLPGQ